MYKFTFDVTFSDGEEQSITVTAMNLPAAIRLLNSVGRIARKKQIVQRQVKQVIPL